MDPEELIRAAQNGDLAAKEELGQWMFVKLSRFFLNCFNKADTDELVQATLQDVWKKLHEFEVTSPDGFRRWVISFAANKARTKGREPHRERGRNAKLGAKVATPRTSPESRVLARERWRLIARHMPRLPEIYRRALEHELDGGDDESLAQREEISLITARTRRFRGRQLLQELIEAARTTPSRHRPRPGSG